MKALDFEASVYELEQKIAELKVLTSELDVSAEIKKMQNKVDKMLIQIYSKLTPWQTVAVARHPGRPKFVDYLQALFTDFVELKGDRCFADDQAIIGGIASFRGKSCMVIGQEKGCDTESRIKHNFGMPKPEGYRKVYRLFDLADRFNLPIITFIDTSGAYPCAESEERGQAEAIAKCLEKSFQIRVPFVAVVIGEGGSGGAIAIGCADIVLMLEHSIYSVISPEGCASILWKDDTKAEIAATAQRLTAKDLLAMQVIDGIIKEPIGGAHRNKNQAIDNTGYAIAEALSSNIDTTKRIHRFSQIGNECVVKY